MNFMNWAYGHDTAGNLERYVLIEQWPPRLSHEEWLLRLARSRGDALSEDVAWTVDWCYADQPWRLGVGGWSLEKAVEILVKEYRIAGHPRRIRNMITGEIIIPEALGL